MKGKPENGPARVGLAILPGSPGQIQEQIAQAVRNSLNLPRLGVEVRRALEPGSWRVRLKRGRNASEWLTLPPPAVNVIKKVRLVPPRLLGQFRLAFDAIKVSKPESRH